MRSIIFSLVALLSIAASAGATETTPREAAVPNVVSATKASPSVDESKLELRRVSVEERQASSSAATAQLGPRGGFWWTVGAIVVAVVIVSVIL